MQVLGEHVPDEYDEIGERLGQADQVVSEFRNMLERMWHAARRYILNAERVSLDGDIYIHATPGHMGDPQDVIDLRLHQYAKMLLGKKRAEIPLYGEEEPPSGFVFDKQIFNHIAYLDALDGTRQAFTLPGGWSVNLILQRYLGGSTAANARFEVELLGAIDAEGVSIIWVPALEGVDLQIADSGTTIADIYSDQLTVTESEFGLTGVTTVLAGGYKPEWWEGFKKVRECCPDVPVFNTAGAPVTRKALQNADIVVAEPRASTLWDGIGAGLIAAAGGYVVRLDDHHMNDPHMRGEPLPGQTVLDWFSQFGYEANPLDPDRFKEKYCIPPFMAGMDGDRVSETAKAYLG